MGAIKNSTILENISIYMQTISIEYSELWTNFWSGILNDNDLLNKLQNAIVRLNQVTNNVK